MDKTKATLLALAAIKREIDFNSVEDTLDELWDEAYDAGYDGGYNQCKKDNGVE